MRMGTFILGGLAGAALAVAFRRNKMLSAVAGSAGQMMKKRAGGWSGMAMEKMLDKRFGASKILGGRDSSSRERHGDRHDDDVSRSKLDQLVSEAARDFNTI